VKYHKVRIAAFSIDGCFTYRHLLRHSIGKVLSGGPMMVFEAAITSSDGMGGALHLEAPSYRGLSCS
jgi:hypothetical protein